MEKHRLHPLLMAANEAAGALRTLFILGFFSPFYISINAEFYVKTALAGSTLAATGWLSNLIVFLIEKFNIKSIDAAQISNVISGSTCFFPVIAAIVADSFLGCFTVIWISSLISVTVIHQSDVNLYRTTFHLKSSAPLKEIEVELV